jgi:hypothetical protein
MAADVTDKVVEKIGWRHNSLFNWMKVWTFQMKLNWWNLWDEVEIVEHILFCKSLNGNATGRGVF